MNGPSFLAGAVAVALACLFLYAAPERMRSSGGESTFRPNVYYVVGNKRFDWFRRGQGTPNALGGFTLDGRRISAVFVSRGEMDDLAVVPDGEDDGVEE